MEFIQDCHVHLFLLKCMNFGEDLKACENKILFTVRHRTLLQSYSDASSYKLTVFTVSDQQCLTEQV